MSILTDRKAFAAELAWRKEQVAEYDIDAQRAEMAECRETIAAKTERRSEIVRRELPDVQQAIEVAEARLLLTINARIDEATGKPAATNEPARKALLTIELSENLDYQCRLAYRTGLQTELDMLDADIDAASKRYAACRQEIELSIAMLRVMGL